MKKTLLARVVKGIAVCGLAMSSISYAATSVFATHQVENPFAWSIEFNGNAPTLSGQVQDTSLSGLGQHWGDLVVRNEGAPSYGKLTVDYPDASMTAGFLWTHQTSGSQVTGFANNPAFASTDFLSGIRLVRTPGTEDQFQTGDYMTIKLGVAAGQVVEAGEYGATFSIAAWTN